MEDTGLADIDVDWRNLVEAYRSMEAKMAFNNVGPLTFLAEGQSVVCDYSYGSDHGSQFASADVKTPNRGAVHLADLQRRREDNNGNAPAS